MARGLRGTKIKAFFSGLFLGQGAKFSSNGIEGRAGPGSLFSGSKNFVVQNLNATVIQRDNGIVFQAMKILSENIIPGAAHDSSARDPPPRCHPGTRIKLMARVATWFNSKKRQKLLLWLNGPAGVGKSAVLQTFAEDLAKSERLGASVFFSRPNKRNDPQRIFITIAYQLAVRIEAYRTFIAERLALDPDLLSKGMREQFQIFITEPFTKMRIGAGEEAWGILLDGLDEVEGQKPQRDIIRLISTFVREHPDVPLVWVIASRPEPHISATFGEEETTPSHWQEYIPINSTEACEDVERFLRASFEAIRKNFPHSIPGDWPGEAKFLKLAAAASGLFVYVSVAVRFIEDADHANPVARLDLVLSVIDRLKVIPPEDQPFAHLDALYTQILASIPPASWLIAKRILGFTLFSRGGRHFTLSPASRTLKGMSMILDLEEDAIYGSLNKCYSILEIPPPKRAYSSSVTFLHTSLADYLMAPTRSGNFHICIDDVEDDVLQGLFRMMQGFAKASPRRSATGSEIYPAWIRYCSRYHSGAFKSRRAPKAFSEILGDGYSALCRMVIGGHKLERGGGPFVSRQDRSECLAYLGQIDVVDLCHGLPQRKTYDFLKWLLKISKEFREECANGGLIREVLFKELKFQDLGCKWPLPVCCDAAPSGPRPNLPTQWVPLISKLEYTQQLMPELKALLLGTTPERRCVVVLCHNLTDMYYVIPYPY